MKLYIILIASFLTLPMQGSCCKNTIKVAPSEIVLFTEQEMRYVIQLEVGFKELARRARQAEKAMAAEDRYYAEHALLMQGAAERAKAKKIQLTTSRHTPLTILETINPARPMGLL
jgi:hypothetical protein